MVLQFASARRLRRSPAWASRVHELGMVALGCALAALPLAAWARDGEPLRRPLTGGERAVHSTCGTYRLPGGTRTGLRALPRPCGAHETIGADRLSSALDDTRETFAGLGATAGVLEARGRALLAASGFLDPQQTIPLDEGDRFPIASITKTFTAAIALQLTEVRFAAAPEIARPTQRIARMHEVRAHAALEIGGSGLSRMGGIELRSLQLAERVRSVASLSDERWSDLPEASALAGAQLTGAFTPRILAAFPARSSGDPAVDLVLQLVPGLLQSASSALGDAWPALASHSASAMVCEGPTDSCYIWRKGGALHAACQAESRG